MNSQGACIVLSCRPWRLLWTIHTKRLEILAIRVKITTDFTNLRRVVLDSPKYRPSRLAIQKMSPYEYACRGRLDLQFCGMGNGMKIVYRNGNAPHDGSSPSRNAKPTGHLRNILASTTSLTALVASAFSGTAQAAEENLWRPSVGGAIGVSEFDTLGTLELFLPVAQDEDSVFFLDLRLDPENISDFNGSFGAGVRQVINSDLMLGANVFYNSAKVSGRKFEGLTIGAEFLTPEWDGHVNYHFSFDSSKLVGGSGAPALSLVGNQLLANINRLTRTPLEGVEAEVGRKFTNVFGEGVSLRFSAGGYHYHDADSNTGVDLTGGKAGFELEYKPYESIYTPRFTLGAEVSHDNVFDTEWSVQARFVIPLGGDNFGESVHALEDPTQPLPSLVVSEGLRSRANDRVRTTGIITLESRTQETVTPVDPRTGNAIGNFTFTDDENTAGAGTFADPTTLDDAITNADVAGFVVALENGLAANINSAGAALQDTQSVVGGGTTINVLVAGVPTMFTLPGAAGTIEGTVPAQAALTLADNNRLENFTVTGAGQGILGNAIGSATFADLAVQNTGGNGIDLIDTTGQFTFANVDISGTGGDGVSVSGGTSVLTFDANSSISQPGGGAAFRAAGGHTGTVQFDGDINATGGTGLQFDDADGAYNFNGAVALNGGDAGIDILNGSAGTFTFANTSITDPTGPALNVDSSSANVTHAGTITQANNAAAVSVSGGDTSTLNLNGPINATSGTGLQFDDADGAYNFNGAVALNGGDAGIDILNGSAGTFTFANTSITDPAGPAFNVDASSANVTHAGTITQANNAAAVSVSGGDTSTLNLNGPINATNGTGLQFDDADGAYNFNGAVALNGGDAGIDILNGSAGTFTFANTSITNPTGPALNVDSSSANVTHAGTITQANNAAAVSVSGGDTSTLNLNGPINATNGTGLQFDDADGAYNFNGAVALNGGDAGIDILNGSAGTFTFGAGTSITDPTGTAFNIDSSSATVTYDGTISQSVAASAVVGSNNTGGTVAFNGLIAANTSTATGVDLTNNTGAAFTFAGGLDIDTTTGTGFGASGGGTVNVTATGGDESINSTGAKALDLDGVTTDITFDSIASANSASEGIEIDGLSAGSIFSVSGLTDIDMAANAGIDIATSEGTFTFANVDIDGAGTVGIQLTDNPGTLTFQGGAIDATAGDGINIVNTNSASFDLFNIAGAADIGGDGVDVTNNDTTDRTFSFTNSNIGLVGNVPGRGVAINSSGTGTLNATLTTTQIQSSQQTIFATASGGTANALILDLTDNGTLTTLTGVPTMEIVGSALNSVIVTTLGANTTQIIGQGPGTGGGILFNQVTFDADGDTSNGNQQVTGGTLQIGQGANAVQRVQGDGLSLLGPTGDLDLTQLTIFNNAGTGLEVDTKIGATTFNLDIAGGSIDTTGGPVLFLDPLGGNINFTSLTTDNPGGTVAGTAANASGNGSGVTLDAFMGTLNVGTTTVSNVGGGTGVLLQNNGAGNYNFGTTAISGVAAGGTGIDLAGGNNAGANFVFGPTTITGTGGTGIDLTNSTGSLDVGNGNSSSIDFGGNGTAFVLNNANSNFVFGDGTAPPNSTVNVAQVFDLTGYVPGQGSYNFLDLDLTNVNLGAPFGAPNLHFFSQNSTGDGSGSDINNASNTTVADAVATGDTIFVAIGETNNVANQAAIPDLNVNVNGDGSFDLAADQDMIFFNSIGGMINVPVTAPAGILLSATAGTVSDVNSVGSPELTSSLIGASVVELGQNSELTDVGIDGGTFGIRGQGNLGTVNLTNVAIQNSEVGVFLTGAPAGTVNLNGTSSITAATGDSLSIDGGSVNVNLNDTSSIDQSGFGAPVNVQNGHTGTITVAAASTINATNGNGLQFGNADGNYNFNGAVTLNGGDAGIDILGGSDGTFTFANTSITNPTGPAFNVDSSSANVTHAGTITQANNAAAVSVSGGDTSTLNLNGPINATNGTGLQFDNADGAYNFNGAVALNGGDAGIDILNGSAGTFTFADTSITDPSGTALNIDGSAATVNYTGGSITQNNAASAVAIRTNTGGTVSIGVPVIANTSTATGVAVENNTGGEFTFSGGLDIDTTTGIGFSAFGFVPGGTINVTGATNTVDVAGAAVRAFDLFNMEIGAAGVTFSSITTTGTGANAISGDAVDLQQITGGAFNAGTINVAETVMLGADGIEIFLNTNASFTFDGVTIGPTGENGIRIDGNSSAVAFNGAVNLTGASDDGIEIRDQSGAVNFNDVVTIATPGDDGIDIQTQTGAVNFNDVLTITMPGDDGVTLSGNTAPITFSNVAISTPGSQGIDIGDSAALTFGDVDITGLGGDDGVDLSGATLTGAVNFNSIDITGTDAAGSVGIDLTGLAGDQIVRFGVVGGADSTTDTPSTINAVQRGVVIDNTAAVQFTFGDGFGPETASAIDVSNIAGAFTVDAGGGTLAASNFNFDDVMVGAGDAANFPAAPNSPIFVSIAGGTVTQTTNNLSQDIATIDIAAAEALPDMDQLFVLVGNAVGNIDLALGGADGFTLLEGQSIDSFNDGNVNHRSAIMQPANITGNLGPVGGTRSHPTMSRRSTSSPVAPHPSSPPDSWRQSSRFRECRHFDNGGFGRYSDQWRHHARHRQQCRHRRHRRSWHWHHPSRRPRRGDDAHGRRYLRHRHRHRCSKRHGGRQHHLRCGEFGHEHNGPGGQ